MTERVFGRGYHRMFREGHLTLGIGVPIESYSSPVPQMDDQIERIKCVEQGGFAAVWCRDVPLLDPSFGDAGQIYDPWVWLGYVAAHTKDITLGTGSIILPLRQPVDLAKSAASVDQLSDGRLVLGVASGDRPVEYSVYERPLETRGEVFRETLEFMRNAIHQPDGWDIQQAAFSGHVHLIPKSVASDLPMIVTGNSRQSPQWIAANSDGWLMYPRPINQQRTVLAQWKEVLSEEEQGWKPFAQSLYIDLTEDPDANPIPIHLGYRLGRNRLIKHLSELREIGVNQVTFNIRFSSRPVPAVLDELCKYVVPEFPAL